MNTKKKQKVVVFGIGEIAEVAHVYLDYDSDFDVVGFTVDEKFIAQNDFRGLPVVPFEGIQLRYPPEDFLLFIPISFRDLNIHRENKYSEAKRKGYHFATYISSKAAVLPETSIGENCFIFENNVLQPKVTISDNCILWSGNHIGHHSFIDSHCFVASHAVISGHVHVGKNTFIGVNSTIRDNVTIGKKNIIGAGALILRDTDDEQVFKGIASKPAEISSVDVRW